MEKTVNYELLAEQIRALAETAPGPVPVMANASALLMDAMEQVNWAGFYLVEEDHLIVGPFQGKPACVRIEKGRGVCGTALGEDALQLVPDVHEFPGHIACDAASRSEIVVPLHHEGGVVAVLDIDSPVKNRFSPEDARGLAAFAGVLEEVIRWK